MIEVEVKIRIKEPVKLDAVPPKEAPLVITGQGDFEQTLYPSDLEARPELRT